MFIFDTLNPIRVACHALNNHAFFINLILVVIGLSSIALAADDPIVSDPQRVLILWWMDLIFTSIFIFETIIKLVDLGIIFHPGSYFRSIWNILDMIVVIGAILGMVLIGEAPGRDCKNPFTLYLIPNCAQLPEETVAAGASIGFIKTLRVFRVLRPLKSVQRLPKLQAVFNGFITSLVNVAPILAIYSLFMLIFAVIGVELFAGKFFYCTDESKMTESECIGDMIVEYDDRFRPIEVVERAWEQREFHFDNVLNAYLSLYVFSTGAGWPDGSGFIKYKSCFLIPK